MEALTDFNFTPSSHYPDKVLLTELQQGAYGMAGRTILPQEAWYDTTVYGRDQNKLGGISFDRKITIKGCGIWNHRDSLRLGWHPAEVKYLFTLYLYMHINGCPFKPAKYDVVRIGRVICGTPFDWKIQALQGIVAGSVDQNGGHQQVAYAHQFVPGEGRVLGLYHGGNRKPVQSYTIKQYTELLLPIKP